MSLLIRCIIILLIGSIRSFGGNIFVEGDFSDDEAGPLLL
jgi:hypothetical protein